jgi:predicted small metal-binding protein
VKRISCSDLIAGLACKRVLEAETDEELFERLREHAAESHPDHRLDEEAAQARIARD